jgi:hypothetical protein
MPNYFLAKIRYQQPIDASQVGTRTEQFVKQKTVTELYLVDAVSFTEAEARTYQEVAANTPDFEIVSLPRYPLNTLIRHDAGDKWYRFKVQFLYENEKTGKLKRISNFVLLNAATPEEATTRLHDKFKTYLTPYELKSVSETDILDVFEFQAEQETSAEQ